jgi:hypothetical protein
MIAPPSIFKYRPLSNDNKFRKAERKDECQQQSNVSVFMRVTSKRNTTKVEKKDEEHPKKNNKFTRANEASKVSNHTQRHDMTMGKMGETNINEQTNHSGEKLRRR